MIYPGNVHWVWVDLTEGGVSQTDDDCKPRKRCVIHKPIRNRQWTEVRKLMREDPSQLVKTNDHGWSSLVLSIYHIAPIDIISEMMSLLSPENLVAMLSTPVTSGARLCLHFAARYTDNVEVIKLLTEAYPPALLATSSDGLTPLNRAVYYRKDASIIQYLEQATRKQQNFDRLQKFNQQLRYTVLLACEKKSKMIECPDQESCNTFCDELNESNALTLELYRYCKDREMISLFGNVLSYVGVQNVP